MCQFQISSSWATTLWSLRWRIWLSITRSTNIDLLITNSFLFKDAVGNTGHCATRAINGHFSWCEKFGIIEFSSKIHLHRLSSSSFVLRKDSLVETRYQTTIGILLIFCEYELICILKLQFSGPEMTTGTIAFATEIFSVCD